MNFCWSTLHVKDLDQSLTFYTEIIGLELVKRFSAGPDTEIAFLGKGQTQIELIDVKDKNTVEVGTDISWGFEVDSLDATLSLIQEKGYDRLSDTIQPNPSVKFFYLLDPNGFKIQIVEHIK